MVLLELKYIMFPYSARSGNEKVCQDIGKLKNNKKLPTLGEIKIILE